MGTGQDPPGINELLALAPVVRPWQTCPVCFGRGWVDAAFYRAPSDPNSTMADLHKPTNCRSCGGRGIVQ